MTNTGADAADQIVNMSLKTTEMAVRLSGTGAKHLALLLIALLKDNKKFKGRTTLMRMLRDGKELSIFRIDTARLKEFALEARRYGVLFTAVRDSKNPQKDTDVMVRAEDAGKINRIIERLKLTTVDLGKIKVEIESSRANENPMKERSAKFSEKSSRSPSANASPGSAASNRSFDKSSIRQRILEIKAERAANQNAVPVPKRIPKPKAR